MNNDEMYFPESGEQASIHEERRRAERFPCSLQPFWRVEGPQSCRVTSPR